MNIIYNKFNDLLFKLYYLADYYIQLSAIPWILHPTNICHLIYIY